MSINPVLLVLVPLSLILLLYGLSRLKKPKKIEPYFTFLFLVCVLFMLFALASLFPPEGIKLGSKTTIRFATIDRILHPDKAKETGEKKKVPEEVPEILELSEEEMAENLQVGETDTILRNKPAPKIKNLDIYELQFPDNDPGILYPFFKALDHASSAGQPVRIMHYGDSQIENDRITKEIRDRLQRKFGGYGPGLIPLQPIYEFESFSYKLAYSGGWYSYTQFSDLSHINEETNRYGALGHFCQFTPFSNDTLIPAGEKEVWLKVSKSPLTFANAQRFQQVRVFYGHNPAPFYGECLSGDVLISADTFPATERIRTMTYSFENTVPEVELKFKGVASPQFFGIALDGINGIAVDNIAMRGKSGLIFTRLDPVSLKQHWEALNVKLIILQFGENAVPNATSETIASYEYSFCRQIQKIKALLPDVGVIVIGVPDMALGDEDGYEPYPKIAEVRDAMKRASFKAGAAYWDMFEAMGGENSMPVWVSQGYGTSDYRHLNPKGAAIIANVFVKALIREYDLYKMQLSRDENPSP